jgi:hypothetical protein
MKLRLGTACLFAALLAAPAAAQTPPDDGPAWAFLVGTWTCTVSNMPGTPVTVSYARGTRSASYTQHVSATFANGTAYAADGWISYDPSAKRWVYISEGALGDYTVATTPGWHEGVLVFTDLLLTGGETGGTTTIKKLNDTTADATLVQSSGTVTQHCVKK